MLWSVILLLLSNTGVGDAQDGIDKAAVVRQLPLTQKCREVSRVECKECQTVLKKVCNIETQEKVVEKPVRRCRRYREPNCQDGYREKCKTSYSSECYTVNKIVEVEEDTPMCRTEKVESCTGNSTVSCRLVGVNRCNIETKLVRRARPESKCERVPSKVCGLVKCRKGRLECREEIVTKIEQLPVEKCQLLPQEECQKAGEACRSVVRKVCRKPGKRRRKYRKKKKRMKKKPKSDPQRTLRGKVTPASSSLLFSPSDSSEVRSPLEISFYGFSPQIYKDVVRHPQNYAKLQLV